MCKPAINTGIFASVFNFSSVVGHRKTVQAPSRGTTLNLQRKQHLEVKEISDCGDETFEDMSRISATNTMACSW
jgi:hypothetical protein